MTLEERRVKRLEDMANNAEKQGDSETAALLRWAAAVCTMAYK